MNDGFSGALVWIVTALLGLVSTLIGFIVHMHIKSDDENHRRIDAELKILRERLHEWAPHMGWVDMERNKPQYEGKEERK